MKNCFVSADLMIPVTDHMERWAVIACDQFTSDRAYWKTVEEQVGDHPSAYHLMLPEAYLEGSNDERIRMIHQKMDSCLSAEVLRVWPDSFVYVERTLQDGSIRQGIVGVMDLEAYSFTKDPSALLLATEQTVLERIPPRMAIREGAAMELSHVIVFCNDPMDRIMSCVGQMKDRLPKAYDFDLMQGGGHISGWLLCDDHRSKLQQVLDDYVSGCNGAACYLVADGNHSLATAKQCYEKLKAKDAAAAVRSPARFAMVELENIHSASISFEPIHRIITQVDVQKFFMDLQSICVEGGFPIRWVSGQQQGTVQLRVPEGKLPLAVFQDYLDSWLCDNEAQIDYIHDDDALICLAQENCSVGFFMPTIDKDQMFSYVVSGSILPRKAFSLGHAAEKRYYLEGRKII